MHGLLIVAVFGLAAFLVAWVANALVGLLSGEKPRDTGSLWIDVFLRFFAILELGLIGRALSYVGLDGWPRKLVTFVGVICLLLFLLKAFHRSPDTHIRTYQYHTESSVIDRSNQP